MKTKAIPLKKKLNYSIYFNSKYHDDKYEEFHDIFKIILNNPCAILFASPISIGRKNSKFVKMFYFPLEKYFVWIKSLTVSPVFKFIIIYTLKNQIKNKSA